MIILVAILMLCYINVKAEKDYQDIQAGIKINHSIGAIISIFIYSLCTIVLTKDSVIDFITNLLIFLNIHWILFDYILNKKRGLVYYYIGRSAFTDRVLRKIGIKNILIPKFSLLAILVSIKLCLYLFL